MCSFGDKNLSSGCNLILFIETPYIAELSCHLYAMKQPVRLWDSSPSSLLQTAAPHAVTHLTSTSPPHIFQSFHSWKEDWVFKEKEGLKMPSLSEAQLVPSNCMAKAHPVASTTSCLDICMLFLDVMNAALLFASVQHIAACIILQPCCFDTFLCNPSLVPLYHFKK